MEATIHNTATATQKGAPNRALNQTANQSSHEPSKSSRNSRRISNLAEINRHKIACSHHFAVITLVDGHAMPSKNAASRAVSTKVEKLMDTLSSGFATKRRQPKVIV
jgi:hypothetical protein